MRSLVADGHGRCWTGWLTSSKQWILYKMSDSFNAASLSATERRGGKLPSRPEPLRRRNGTDEPSTQSASGGSPKARQPPQGTDHSGMNCAGLYRRRANRTYRPIRQHPSTIRRTLGPAKTKGNPLRARGGTEGSGSLRSSICDILLLVGTDRNRPVTSPRLRVQC